MKYKKGFTILELLVVIAIIGGLASVILPQIQEARKKTEYTKFYADVKAFYDGIHIYMTNKPQFPVHADCRDFEYTHSMITNLTGDVQYSTILSINNSQGWCVYQMPTSTTPTNSHILSLLNSEGIFTRDLKIPEGTQVWYGQMSQYYLDTLDMHFKCGDQLIAMGKPYLWGFVSASSSKYLPKERARFVEIENWSGDEYPYEPSFCFYLD